MKSISGAGNAHRAQVTIAIKAALREVGIQLSSLNYLIGAELGLRHIDYDCFNIVARYGPISPRLLARRTGLHLATLTGVLDRLESARWIVRDPDPSDRRAVLLRALSSHLPEIGRLYAGMHSTLEQLCARYTEDELRLITGFLQQTIQAGSSAAEQLADRKPRKKTR